MQRNTVQRSVVLDAVLCLKNHPTAEQVYNEISKRHPSISRATVYRNLNNLAEDGEIGKIDVLTHACHFDHLISPHYHAKCNICHRLFDVEMDYISDLEHSVKSSDGFVFLGHTMVFSGICSQCQKIKK